MNLRKTLPTSVARMMRVRLWWAQHRIRDNGDLEHLREHRADLEPVGWRTDCSIFVNSKILPKGWAGGYPSGSSSGLRSHYLALNVDGRLVGQ